MIYTLFTLCLALASTAYADPLNLSAETVRYEEGTLVLEENVQLRHPVGLLCAKLVRGQGVQEGSGAGFRIFDLEGGVSVAFTEKGFLYADHARIDAASYTAIFYSSPSSREPVTYRDAQGESEFILTCAELTVKFSEDGKGSVSSTVNWPINSIEGKGGVRITKKSHDEEQYALSDSALYNPQTQCMTLSAQPGEKVLYYHLQHDIQISARQIEAEFHEDAEKPVVRGIGNVTIHLNDVEMDKVRKAFNL